jgi:hypothetical protein
MRLASIGWDNRRKSKRRSFVFPATIYRLDRTIFCGCTIVDVSETGARFRIYRKYAEIALDLPERFYLSMTSRDDILHKTLSVARECELVWRRDRDVGVRFLHRTPAS